jgi:hypothetical protein
MQIQSHHFDPPGAPYVYLHFGSGLPVAIKPLLLIWLELVAASSKPSFRPIGLPFAIFKTTSILNNLIVIIISFTALPR